MAIFHDYIDIYIYILYDISIIEEMARIGQRNEISALKILIYKKMKVQRRRTRVILLGLKFGLHQIVLCRDRTGSMRKLLRRQATQA